MKSNLYLVLGVACTLFFSACKKSGSNADDNSPKKFISKISWGKPGEQPTTLEFTYDDKKQLIKTKRGDVITDYIYNTDGSLFSYEFYPPNSYAFRNGQELRYEGGNLREVKRIRFNGNAILNLDPYKFAYNENDRLTIMQAEGRDIAYSYDSRGNTIEEKSDILTVKRTFDDKKSIYTNFPPALKKVGNQISQTFYSCPNNPTSVSAISLVTNTTTFTYTYDKDGYPVSAVSTTNGNITNYTYTYVEL